MRVWKEPDDTAADIVELVRRPKRTEKYRWRGQWKKEKTNDILYVITKQYGWTKPWVD